MNKDKFSEIMTYVILYLGVAVVTFGWCYSTVHGAWWLVPAVALLVVPPTVYVTNKVQKEREYHRARQHVVRMHGDIFARHG